MPPVSIQDIQLTLDSVIQRWDTVPTEKTEAAKTWRSLGGDDVVRGFVRQVAFNILKRRLENGELDDVQYLRVDVKCALGEAMLKPRSLKETAKHLRCRALMRCTLDVCMQY